MRKLGLLAGTLMALLSCADSSALTLEKIKFGDFSNWVTREITESKVIGGKTKTVYAIGPTQMIKGNVPYSPKGGSPWASSNVYAKVSGVVKASNTVEPAVVNGNKMAKLYTKIEQVKVLGLLNMDVMVPGTIFLGKVREPISSTKSPYSKMEMGMPYTKRPKALVYDLKVDMPNVNTRVRLFSSPETLGRFKGKYPCSPGRHRKRTLQPQRSADQRASAADTLRKHYGTALLQALYGAPERRQGIPCLQFKGKTRTGAGRRLGTRRRNSHTRTGHGIVNLRRGLHRH